MVKLSILRRRGSVKNGETPKITGVTFANETGRTPDGQRLRTEKVGKGYNDDPNRKIIRVDYCN